MLTRVLICAEVNDARLQRALNFARGALKRPVLLVGQNYIQGLTNVAQIKFIKNFDIIAFCAIIVLSKVPSYLAADGDFKIRRISEPYSAPKMWLQSRCIPLSRIPYVLHLMWLDKDPKVSIPPKYHSSISEIINMHPKWTVMVWTNRNYQELLTHPEDAAAFHALHPHISKCDYLRFVAVRNYGGWYVDIDFIFLRPLDTIGDVGTFAVVKERRGTIANGIFGATAGHQQVNNFLRFIRANWKRGVKKVLDLAGPFALTKFVKQTKQAVTVPTALVLPVGGSGRVDRTYRGYSFPVCLTRWVEGSQWQGFAKVKRTRWRSTTFEPSDLAYISWDAVASQYTKPASKPSKRSKRSKRSKVLKPRSKLKLSAKDRLVLVKRALRWSML